MAYDVGTTISFQKGERQTATQFLYDVGTHLKLILTEAGDYRIARRIEVALG